MPHSKAVLVKGWFSEKVASHISEHTESVNTKSIRGSVLGISLDHRIDALTIDGHHTAITGVLKHLRGHNLGET